MLSWCSVLHLLNKVQGHLVCWSWSVIPQICVHLSLPILWTACLILHAMLPRLLSHVASQPGSVKGGDWPEAGERQEDQTRYLSSFLSTSGIFLECLLYDSISHQTAPAAWSQFLDHKNIAPSHCVSSWGVDMTSSWCQPLGNFTITCLSSWLPITCLTNILN